MFTEREEQVVKKIIDKIDTFFQRKIIYENLEEDKNELNLFILSLYHLKWHIKEKEELEKICKIESKVWKHYFNMTGIKHQHDLFCEMNELDDENKKEKLREIAQNIKYSNLYFADISKYGKSYFSYSAEILKLRGYPFIEDVIVELLVWMQDINWPGSYEIFQLLCTIPKNVFLPLFERTVKKAYQANDKTWLSWLYPFLISFQIQREEFSEKELFDVLQKYSNV